MKIISNSQIKEIITKNATHFEASKADIAMAMSDLSDKEKNSYIKSSFAFYFSSSIVAVSALVHVANIFINSYVVSLSATAALSSAFVCAVISAMSFLKLNKKVKLSAKILNERFVEEVISEIEIIELDHVIAQVGANAIDRFNFSVINPNVFFDRKNQRLIDYV